MNAHTPGPWKPGTRFPGRIIHGTGAAGKIIGYATQFPDDADNLNPEELANAHLIAAAPDMLEALKALYEHCAMTHSKWGDGSNAKEADSAIKAGRFAIAKAEGKQ